MMCKFFVECRQKNSSPYSLKTIVQLSSNLQSLALIRNPTACQYMESKDVRFKAFHNVLDNISKNYFQKE